MPPPSAEPADELLHVRRLRLHAAEQRELGAGALEVVVRVRGLLVGVALQEVREETQSLLVGDDAGRQRQGLDFGRVQESADGFQVSLAEGGEDRLPHLDTGEVGGIFRRRVGPGPHHVVKVVEGEAGHYGVAIDDAAPMAGAIIRKHIGDLRVVVRDAPGNSAAALKLLQYAGQRRSVERWLRCAQLFRKEDAILFRQNFPFRPLIFPAH